MPNFNLSAQFGADKYVAQTQKIKNPPKTHFLGAVKGFNGVEKLKPSKSTSIAFIKFTYQISTSLLYLKGK